MFSFLLLYILCCVYGLKISVGSNSNHIDRETTCGKLLNRNIVWNTDYLSKEKTNAIKGIFVMMVLISHYCGCYIFRTPGNSFTSHLIRDLIGQQMVVMFLFYSGYGIMESYKKKGKAYAINMPVQRILKLLFDYDIIVLIFFVIYICFGKQWTISQFILSFLGWDSFGNSNWYVFAIICCYIFSFVAFIIARRRYWLVTIIVTVLSFAYLIVVNKYKEAYWTNTILCYALGMWYSVFKGKIENFIQKNNFIWIFSLVVLAVLYVALSRFQYAIDFVFEIRALIFALIVVFATMKFSFDNVILRYFGSNVFGVYMLQRIPMVIMQNLGLFNGRYISMKFIVTVLVTIVLATLYKKFMECSSKLFRKIEIKKAVAS
ncbi:MAG: acyltransferase [Clostridia bacterium]|nr:acyltransferase [Clostridia bacterium]